MYGYKEKWGRVKRFSLAYTGKNAVCNHLCYFDSRYPGVHMHKNVQARKYGILGPI
jgi:hypothetical protein